ncbi:hypothetical protein BGZ76_010143, partial [Entomortierella beljakovae]
MEFSFPSGLNITAISARELAKRKRFGAQDPYLLFSLQKRRKFTQVAVKGGVKPVWNQMIKYNRVEDGTSASDTTLLVSCYHEKGVKGSQDDLIGSCEIDLKQVVLASRNGVVETWFHLTYNGKDSGQVKL